MNLVKLTGLITVLATVLLLTGCYEEAQVQVHQPGQYMGPQDPLLKLAGTAEQNERLAKRLQAIQTDR